MMATPQTQIQAERRPSFTPARTGVLQRKCACGGTPGPSGECAECRKKRMLQPKLTINEPGDKYEQEADRIADQVMRMPDPGLQRQAAPEEEEEEAVQAKPLGGHITPLLQRQAGEEEEDEELLQTKPLVQRQASDGGGAIAPPEVHDVLRGLGQPLDASTRAFMEPRFGHDFSQVRVHSGKQAADSARGVRARAFTVGRDVVFGVGEYAPSTEAGGRLLAHELAHVVQQSSPLRGVERVQRTPAKQVSCGSAGPLQVPATPPFVVKDPVGVITAAETRAQTILDTAIDELNHARQQVLAGSPIAWPTISDALGHALEVMGLDPNSETVWKKTGLNTAHLLLRRLGAIRKTIGAGSFFFTCLGPNSGKIGKCAGPICKGAAARSCAGSFRIVFCVGFWQQNAQVQGNMILHESAHNFADFIQDSGREGNAYCYTRFAEILSGTPETNQRTDQCPNP